MPKDPDILEDINSLRDARHVDKTMYLGSHDMFYEFNYNSYSPTGELLAVVEDVIAQSGRKWRAGSEGVWTHVVPIAELAEDISLPKQGWKIHVSANNLNCAQILGIVAGLLIPLRTQFKFANDVQTLRLLTAKRWPRGGSGKFITIYPRTTDEFKTLIEKVHRALAGYRGSYILSDRRYQDSGCVYYRYGGIQSTKIIDLLGRSVEVLTAPDDALFIDRRNPYYEAPPWVDEVFPDEGSELDADEMSLNEGRFTIESALSFSNTGGVYLAYDTHADLKVVIKEARPGVELGLKGDDATERLAHEADILTTLNDSGITPKLITTFNDWENFYLVEEFLDARNMRQIMLDDSPLLKVNADRSDSERFYDIFVKIFVSLLTSVDEFHRRGIVIGDLSPMNILVDDATLTVRIIDLEGAFHADSDVTQEIHTPGFRVNVKGRKKESDYRDDIYAVGVIMMYSMFPVAAMAYLREDVFETVLPVLIADIGWKNTPVLTLIRRLVDGTIGCADAAAALKAGTFEGDATLPSHDPDPLPANAEMVRNIGRFIVGHWRSDPNFTIFPIDPFGQVTNPAGFFFGSSGIVWALSQNGIAVPDAAMERYRSEVAATRADGLSPGLMTGAAGIALALIELDEAEKARIFIDTVNSRELDHYHHSLYYGAAGIGLVNLTAHHRLGGEKYLARAVAIAKALERSAKKDDRGIYWQDSGGVRLGLGYGQSGVALFLLRLAQMLGEPKWRKLGRQAVEFDLSHGVELEPGVTSFGGEAGELATVFPYIEQGSGGIAKVAMRYGLWDGLDRLIANAHRKYSGFPGLIFGLTGFLDVMTDAQRYSNDPKYGEMAALPLRGLRDLYLFHTPHGLAAPGENLFRVSCDYATGLAGIMYTLHRHEHQLPDSLTLDWLDQQPISSKVTRTAHDHLRGLPSVGIS